MDNLLINLYTGELGLFDFGQEIDIYNLVVENNLSVGYELTTEDLAAVAVGISLGIGVEGNGSLAATWMNRHSTTAALGSHMMFARSRGLTHATAAVVADDDVLGNIYGVGFDGVDYALSSSIRMEVDDPTPAATDMGGAIVFSTALAGTEALVDRVRIENTGKVIINDTGIDSDTQIKGLADDNLIYCDANTDSIGIGKVNPGVKLDIISNSNDETVGLRLYANNLSQNSAMSWGGIAATSTFKISTGGVLTFNDAALDRDTQIKGNGTTDLLYCDALANRVGIGQAVPGAKLEVESITQCLLVDCNSDDGGAIWASAVTNTNAGAGIAGGIDLSDANLDRVMKFAADATDPTGGGGAATGRIPIDIGGATVYIAYY